jgi:hypothetical protein
MACNDGLFCTATDTCVGGTCSGLGTPCPPGGCATGCDEAGDRCVRAAAGTVCRPAVDLCDVDETCDGVSADCPADRFESSTYVCSESIDPCDPAELCTGSSAACPPDVVLADGYPCDLGLGCGEPQTCWMGTCVVTEFCDYSDNDCDGATDEGVSCSDALGQPWCPGDWSFVRAPAVCTEPLACQICLCNGALAWESCDPDCYDCAG